MAAANPRALDHPAAEWAGPPVRTRNLWAGRAGRSLPGIHVAGALDAGSPGGTWAWQVGWPGKGCVSGGRRLGYKSSPWGLGARSSLRQSRAFEFFQAPIYSAPCRSPPASGSSVRSPSDPRPSGLHPLSRRGCLHLGHFSTMHCLSPLLSQTVRAPGQRRPGSWVRGHHLRAELWPRPLWHRRDPDQRSCQRARPPQPDCTPGAAPRPQRQPAPAHRPPLRGAAGPRLSALVSR